MSYINDKRLFIRLVHTVLLLLSFIWSAFTSSAQQHAHAHIYEYMYIKWSTDSLTIVLNIGYKVFSENICGTSFSHYIQHGWWLWCGCLFTLCGWLLTLMLIIHVATANGIIVIHMAITMVAVIVGVAVTVSIIIVIFAHLVDRTTKNSEVNRNKRIIKRNTLLCWNVEKLFFALCELGLLFSVIDMAIDIACQQDITKLNHKFNKERWIRQIIIINIWVMEKVSSLLLFLQFFFEWSLSCQMTQSVLFHDFFFFFYFVLTLTHRLNEMLCVVVLFFRCIVSFALLFTRGTTIWQLVLPIAGLENVLNFFAKFDSQ